LLDAAAVSAFDFTGFYDARWRGRDGYFEHHRKRFLQTWDLLAAQDLVARRGTVLDVAGVGPMADALAQQGWQVHATTHDLRGPQRLPAGFCDLVLCTEIVEHIKDVDSDRITDLQAFNYSGVENMLRELAGVMRPAGSLVVTTPNAVSWHTLHKWLHGELPLFEPLHVREFTPALLGEVAARCGLAIASMQVIDSWPLASEIDFAACRSLVQQNPRYAQVPRGDNIVAVLRHAP
jgi:2-polyprenyl-3-methyl-5-hydroxy-6-metoxy-1,4-benzoquinol methylase